MASSSTKPADEPTTPASEGSDAGIRLTPKDLNVLAAAMLTTSIAVRKDFFENLETNIDDFNKWLGTDSGERGVKTMIGTVKSKITKLAAMTPYPEALQPSVATPKKSAKRAAAEKEAGEEDGSPKKAAKGKGAKRATPAKGGKKGKKDTENAEASGSGSPGEGADTSSNDAEKTPEKEEMAAEKETAEKDDKDDKAE